MLVAGTSQVGGSPVDGGLFVAAALVYLFVYHDLVGVGGFSRYVRAGVFASAVSLGISFTGVVVHHAMAV